MAFPGIADCSTQVADERLLYAGKYASYVHGLGMEEQSGGMFPVALGTYNDQVSMLSGMGCGSDCNCSCTKKAISGLGAEPRYDMFPPGPKPEPYTWKGWTLVLVDGKWMYRNPSDSRLFVTPSNLYDMMGIKKDMFSGFPNVYPKNPNTFDWLLKGGAVTLVVGGIGTIALISLLKNKPKRKPHGHMTSKYIPNFGNRFKKHAGRKDM